MDSMPSAPSPVYLLAAAVILALAWLLRLNERSYRARSQGRRDGAPYLSRLRRRRPSPVVRGPEAQVAEPKRPVPAGPIPVAAQHERPTGTFEAGVEGEARVGAVLRTVGMPVLENFYVESRTGYSQVDHLVHAGGCLVVIETKNLAGTLRGAGRAKWWTQSRPATDDRTFYSPLLQAEGQRERLKALLTPTTRAVIEVLVVLAGKASPPQGAPENVIALADLSRRLQDMAGREGGRDGADIAWAQLRHAVSVTPQIQARLAHAMDHERRALWARPPDAHGAAHGVPGTPVHTAPRVISGSR